MFELLAAIQKIEPTAIPLVAIMASSAAMYLIGILLPCSACCLPPCSQCTEGELPDTVTVTLDGYADKEPGPYLCTLTFSACFGSGAAGRVTAPGGDPVLDKGPITAVEITNAGGGYAKLGRVAPTITLSGGSGTGATLTPTVTSSDDACDVPYWSISSVAVTGGTGYLDGDPVTVTVAAGDTQQTAAAATIHTTRTAPSLTASVSPGTGAVFALTYTASSTTPTTWSISDVDVTSGGTGYEDYDFLTITLGSGDHQNVSADAQIWTTRLEPTLSAAVSSDTGSGADLAVTLAMTTDWESRDLWEVSGLSITDGGTDYEVGDTIAISTVAGQEWWGSYFYAQVDSVDAGGAITGITIYYGGGYYLDGGVIESVNILDGGSYYHDDGVPTTVSVEGGGIYFREDASEPPYVADVTISISQNVPSAGAGAVLTATVEDDTASANFGKITAVAITDAGDDYLAWRWLANDCCGHYLNGKTVVLKRGDLATTYGQIGAVISGHYFPAECVYSHRMCGGWDSPFGFNTGFLQTIDYVSHFVQVGYRGPLLPPLAAVQNIGAGASNEMGRDGACRALFSTDTLIENCSAFAFEGTGSNGKTISISPGGDYDAQDGYAGGSITGCSACCQGSDVPPQEITVDVQDLRPFATTNLSGQYVLSKLPYLHHIWTINIPNAISPGVAIQFRVWLDASFCAKQPDAGGCDHCVKKCAVFAGATSGAFFGGDNRVCDKTDAEQCAAICLDTPMCAPPQGIEFPINFTNFCDDPEFIITT